MKIDCICGYVYHEDFNEKDEWAIIEGDEKFLHLQDIHKKVDFDFTEYSLYVCPKCHTVKVDI